MSKSEYKIPLLQRKILPNLPQSCMSGDIQLFAAEDNQIMVLRSTRKGGIKIILFDPNTGKSSSQKTPLRGANKVLVLNNKRFVFIKQHPEEGSSSADFMLWDFNTKEQFSFVGDMPPGCTINYDVWDDKLYLIASYSDGGSSCGFEWKSDGAYAATINLNNFAFEEPFHEIEDLDVQMMAMLDYSICFVQAYSRTRSYFHLRDVNLVGVQDGNGPDTVSNETDLKQDYRYKLSPAGRDSAGGLLFLGEEYCDPVNALFRWSLENPEFEEVGKWQDFNGYYSSTVLLNDGSTLVICSERKNANMMVRRYLPGEKAVDIAQIEDVYLLYDLVQGNDGKLYLFGCSNALKDGKWLISGELQFSVVDIGSVLP
jgi:hypothetical protein